MADGQQKSLLTLGELADRLHYDGRDRERSVRRCFRHYGVPLVRRDGRGYLATEQQFAALLEAMTCSLSEKEGATGTSGARSASVKRRASSKNTLRAAIAEKMQKPIELGSSTRSGENSFTVVEGGRIP